MAGASPASVIATAPVVATRRAEAAAGAPRSPVPASTSSGRGTGAPAGSATAAICPTAVCPRSLALCTFARSVTAASVTAETRGTAGAKRGTAFSATVSRSVDCAFTAGDGGLPRSATSTSCAAKYSK